MRRGSLQAVPVKATPRGGDTFGVVFDVVFDIAPNGTITVG